MDEQQNKENKVKKAAALQPKRGLWKPEEDLILRNYVETHGEGNWATVSKRSGLMRGGKSCRLRWKNYLRPNIKRGGMSKEEEDLIIRMHKLLGNRWSLIAGRLPGRTDNEVKNYWNTHLNKKSVLGKRKSMEMHHSSNNQTDAAASVDKEMSQLQPHLVIDTKKPATQSMHGASECDDPVQLQVDHVQPVLITTTTTTDGDDEKKLDEILFEKDHKKVVASVKEEMVTSSGSSTSVRDIGACIWMEGAGAEAEAQWLSYDYEYYGKVESPVNVMMQVMNPNYSNMDMMFDHELQPPQPYLDSFLLFEAAAAAAAFGSTVDEAGIHSFNCLPALDP